MASRSNCQYARRVTGALHITLKMVSNCDLLTKNCFQTCWHAVLAPYCSSQATADKHTPQTDSSKRHLLRIIDTSWKYGRAPGVLAGEVVRVDAAEHELAARRAGRVAVEPEGKDGRRDQALVHRVLERRPRAAHRDLRKCQALRAPPQSPGAEGALERARNVGDIVTRDAKRAPPNMISHEGRYPARTTTSMAFRAFRDSVEAQGVQQA